MAVTSDKAAPYAPASAIVELIQRHRSRGLPSPINAEVLGRASILESLIPRTLQALQTLDLINEKGEPTSTFEGLRKAPEGEYRQRFTEWLNGAYADVIKFVDPAKDDETAARDAFRNYIPVGQQPRMVSLFLNLFAAAGVRSPEKSAQPRPQRNAQPRPRANSASVAARSSARSSTIKDTNSGLPPALAGLLSSLPQDGRGWTQATRDRFVMTFGTVLDFCFPVITQSEADAQEE